MQGIIFLVLLFFLFSKFKNFAEKIGLELNNDGNTHFFNENPPAGFAGSNKKWYRNLSGTFVAKKAKGNIDRAMKILVPGNFTFEKLNSARSTANQEAAKCLTNKNAAGFYSSLIKRINDETNNLAEKQTASAKRKIKNEQQAIIPSYSTENTHPIFKALKDQNTIKQSFIIAEILKRKG